MDTKQRIGRYMVVVAVVGVYVALIDAVRNGLGLQG